MFEIFDGESRMIAAELPWADAGALAGLDKPLERSYQRSGNVVHQLWPIVDVTPDLPFTVASGRQP